MPWAKGAKKQPRGILRAYPGFWEGGMLFNSLKFVLFFPLAAAGSFVLPCKLRNLFLLLASYFFYMCWNPKYALLMLFSTLVTWGAGLLLPFAKHERGKKWVVAACLALNLGVLVVFKYAGFVLQNLNALLGALGLGAVGEEFSVLLPVGISFYTFQAIGYTIDVYRGRLRPEKNFFTYALFVSFFPQLVAGPIERSTNMLPQLRVSHPFDYDEAKAGLVQMLWGYLQKLVIADRLALLVDAVFSSPGQFGSVASALAAVFFAVQLYCDFSSYSDIAIGAARVMGFRLSRNFNAPYLSASIGEFWANWHMTLSGWFRDYLYIPLGGNRKGLARTCINLMVVFLVSGLWHGAAWTFVFWGALHGAYSVASRLSGPLRARLLAALGVRRQSRLHHALCVLLTFAFVVLAFVFFRAESLADAAEVLKALLRWNPAPFGQPGFEGLGIDAADFWVGCVSVLCLFVTDLLRKKHGPLTPLLLAKPLAVQWAALLAGIAAIVVFGMYGAGYKEVPFIYFQF